MRRNYYPFQKRKRMAISWITQQREVIETWSFLCFKEENLACPTVWNLIGGSIDQSGELSFVTLRTMLWMYRSSHWVWWIFHSIANIFLFQSSYCWGFYLFPFMSSRVPKKSRDFPKLVKINVKKVSVGVKHNAESIGEAHLRFEIHLGLFWWDLQTTRQLGQNP